MLAGAAMNSQNKSVQKQSGPAAAVPAGWTTPVNISKTGWSSELPSIAIDADGKAYATWTEWVGGVGAPRYMMFNSNKSGLWPDAVRSPLAYTAIDDTGFPSIAVHPTNGSAYLAYHDADWSIPSMEIVFQEYVNGVKTRDEFMSKTEGSSSYVSLAVNPVDGFLYAVWMEDPWGTDTFELACRYRNPATGQWDVGDVIPAFEGSSKYMPNLTFDKNGTAHLVFIRRAFEASIWYTKNTTPRNHSAWTAPLAISGGTGLNWTYPKVAADADGNAYVVWYEEWGPNREVLLRRQVNGAWQAAENISQTPDWSEGATIAVNPDTKDIWIAWQEWVGGTNWEVFMKSYEAQTPGGPKTWSENINFTNNPTHSGEPNLRLGPDGSLYLVYHDVEGGNWEIMYSKKQATSVTVTSPNGGESWQAGTTHNITWTTQGTTVANVKIELSTNGGTGYSTIIASTPNNGSYAWTVPNTPSSNCLVRISDAANASNFDVSNSVFTIAPSPITVTSPNGGESWQAGTAHNITWTIQGATVANVKIELSTNGGTGYSTIIASTPNNGSYAWTVPNTPSANCLVRISDAANAGISNVSDSAFTITPPPSPPLSPAIDTRLNADETKKINKITWAANPLNAAIPLKNYKIYRKPIGAADSSFVVISSASSSVLHYEDSNLDIATKYAYRLTSLSTFDVESEPSSTVTESRKFEFPPLNAALQTTVNRILFYREKNNTITFEKNAFNDDNDVNGYRIYRKKATDDDDQFVAIKTLDSSTFSHKDARLPINPTYAYAVTTVYKDGRESLKSATITEK
jgi:hypothetical protein